MIIENLISEILFPTKVRNNVRFVRCGDVLLHSGVATEPRKTESFLKGLLFLETPLHTPCEGIVISAFSTTLGCC